MRLGLTGATAYDIRCQEHQETTDWSPERNGAWDYVCTIVAQPRSDNPKQVKVGVRVRHDSITDVSQPHEPEMRYIRD